MQSLLQYRRFCVGVQHQLKRDEERARGLQGLSTTEKSAEDSDETLRNDTERGRPDVGAPAPRRQLPEGVHPGDLDPAIDQQLPREEQDTMHENQRPREFQEEKEEQLSDKSLHDDEEEDDEDHELAAMSRWSTSRTQRSEGTALGTALTGIDVRERRTHEGGEGNVFVVGYEGPDDPMDPHNWSRTRRFAITFMVASIGAVVGIASAITSSAIVPAAAEFHVSEVVESMATGLFLVGFGLGSLFAGPISETVGRNIVYLTTLVLYMIFIMASALSPNIGAQLAFRFIAGCFASTPLTCAGGSLSDIWSPMERTYAFPIFANAAFSGPLLGPVMGGWIVQSSLISWRWVEWITLIISGLVTVLVFFFLPETYPPILLKWKAQHLRELTGDDRYRAELEIRSESFSRRLRRALYRPFLLTFREPIIILIALYLSIVYIVLFGFLEGYNYIFAEIHGTSDGITGLCFLGIIVGLFSASLLVPLIYKWAKEELRRVQENGGTKVAPEFRLWYSMLGGSIAIPVSLFWMAWTSYSWISIWSPLASSVLFGYGILCVFITSYQYLIDSYEVYAASALASATLIRYIASGGMVIIATPFYKNMGVHWTLTILGCLSALLAPLPYVFYKYGPWIRSKSKYAVR